MPPKQPRRPRPPIHTPRELRDAEAFLARQHALPDVEPPASPRHFLAATKRAVAFTRQMQTIVAQGRRRSPGARPAVPPDDAQTTLTE